MRLECVELAGWMPFDEPVKLVLPAGPIAVVGMHGDDTRRSNRAGKTSLLEAITWCLYGAHRKRLDDQIINKSCSSCIVCVRLGDLCVLRSRTRGSSTKLSVKLADSELLTGAAAQEAIERAIGLELGDYLVTSCFPQGDVEAIIARSASERMTLVSDWLQHSRWLEARQLQLKKTASANTALSQWRAVLATSRENVLAEDERTAMSAELGRLKTTLTSLGSEAAAVSQQLLDVSAARAQRAKRDELVGLRGQVLELRKTLQGRAAVESEKAAAVERETFARDATQVAKAALDATTAVRAKGFDGKCPVMCAACPVASLVTETVQNEVALFAERQAEYADELRKWREARDLTLPVERRAAEFERFAAQYHQLTERGKQLAGDLKEEPDVSGVLKGEVLQAKLDDLQQQMRTASNRAGEIAGQLEAASVADERCNKVADTVARAERNLQVNELALRAISAIPARIAAQQLGELEREANMLLAGSGVSLRFSLWRELADWAPVCEECGFVFDSKRVGRTCPHCSAKREKKRAQELEILCDDGSGLEEDVRYNSGGTRALVGSAIRLAASAMLRRLRSSQAAWAIVDEPFGSLDAENREQLARTFAGMLSSVGLEQALVVSHDQALLAALPNRIVVTKEGASSTAKLE